MRARRSRLGHELGLELIIFDDHIVVVFFVRFLKSLGGWRRRTRTRYEVILFFILLRIFIQYRPIGVVLGSWKGVRGI